MLLSLPLALLLALPLAMPLALAGLRPVRAALAVAILCQQPRRTYVHPVALLRLGPGNTHKSSASIGPGVAA